MDILSMRNGVSSSINSGVINCQKKKKRKKKEKKKKNGSSLVISSYLHGQMTPNLYVLLIQNIDKNEV